MSEHQKSMGDLVRQAAAMLDTAANSMRSFADVHDAIVEENEKLRSLAGVPLGVPLEDLTDTRWPYTERLIPKGGAS